METLGALLVALIGVAIIIVGYGGWNFFGRIHDRWARLWAAVFGAMGLALVAYVAASI